MFKSIFIKNFQSHKDSYLSFDEGVNIIIGSSDSGKTAILRALRWLIWNRPSGDAFRSNWGGQTVVHLETDTDSIDRWKHNYENAYRLNTQTNFEAVKTDVPKEVQDALNISDINLQQQLDSPFLLSETPGAVAQHFNRVAHLDMIDSGLQNIQKWIRELEQTIRYKDAEIKVQEESLQTYVHLDKFEAEVEVLEDLDNRLHQKESGLQRLSKLIRDYHGTEEEISGFNDLLSLEGKVDEVLKLINDRAELDIKQVKLCLIIDNIREVKEDIQQAGEIITLESSVNTLLKLHEDCKTAVALRKQLFTTLSNVRSIEVQLSTAEAAKGRLQAEFDKIKVCPFCGSKINN